MLVVAADEPADLMSVVATTVRKHSVAVRGVVGDETGQVGPFVGGGASCWGCFEQQRLGSIMASQRV